MDELTREDQGDRRSLKVMDVLARQADLHQARSNRPARTGIVGFNRMKDAAKAQEKLVAYATECLAQGSHRLMNAQAAASFSFEVQDRLLEVGKMLDHRIHDGPDVVGRRRALLQRAEDFVSFSPHYHGNDHTDDNQEIADCLNEADAETRMPLAILERELGSKRPFPSYSGGVDAYFSAEQARRFADAFGHLHQTLMDHVRQREPVMAGQPRAPVDWRRPGDAGRVAQALDRELQALGSDVTLERFEQQYKAREQRAVNETSEFSGAEEATHGRAGSKRSAEAAGLSQGGEVDRSLPRARLDERQRHVGRDD